jgi:hypothetical protein
MWKLTMLVSHMEKLPPAVQEYWKSNFNVATPAGDVEKDEKKEGKGSEKHDYH